MSPFGGFCSLTVVILFFRNSSILKVICFLYSTNINQLFFFVLFFKRSKTWSSKKNKSALILISGWSAIFPTLLFEGY